MHTPHLERPTLENFIILVPSSLLSSYQKAEKHIVFKILHSPFTEPCVMKNEKGSKTTTSFQLLKRSLVAHFGFPSVRYCLSLRVRAPVSSSDISVSHFLVRLTLWFSFCCLGFLALASYSPRRCIAVVIDSLAGIDLKKSRLFLCKV